MNSHKFSHVLIALILGLSLLGASYAPVTALAPKTGASSAGMDAARILYVTPGGTGDCSAWAQACALQSALAAALSGDEIWVAAGVYKPTADADPNATFQLVEGVAVYGGFAGTETARAQRSPTANLTILSGDIDNNDSQAPVITDIVTVTGNLTNSIHVVTAANGATLDGFTVTAGYAAGSGWAGYAGGMIILFNSATTVMNTTFTGNYASIGAGMFTITNSPVLTHVIFTNNYANYGGAMANFYGSSPVLTDVTFSGNSANFSGGMYNVTSSPVLLNVTFNDNLAYIFGGGMGNHTGSNPVLTNVTFRNNTSIYYSGGGMYNDSSSPTLSHVTFSGNSAINGGAMGSTSGSSPQIHNSIFWGNTAANAGAQIYVEDHASLPALNDSIVQDGCPSGASCTNILPADPLLGAFGNYGGFTPTLALLPGSAAIDAASPAFCPPADQRGVARPQGAGCDIGAYELENTVPLPLPTSTTLSSAPTLATLNQPVSLTAAVFAQAPATGTPSGTVTFMDGATPLAANVPLVNGLAQFTLSSLKIGAHAITAVYHGDAHWLGSTAPAASVSVAYKFVGFSAPVDNPAVMNVAKAGQAVPLKWRLLDFNNAPVTNLAGVTVTAAGLNCPMGTSTDLIEEYAAGNSGLQNLGNGYYQWNWKTPAAYASSCKTLLLDLGEGAALQHTALFQFKK